MTHNIIAFLLPVPFLMVLLCALLVSANGKRNKYLGYAGAAAGAITLALVIVAAQQPGTTSVPWFSVGGTVFSWTVMVDALSILLAAIVSGIGAIIFLYSSGYLGEDEDHKRFYAEMALFAAAMIGVVTSGNLFQTFFCWELVGVSSYLLIGFWHGRESAIAAARKAFITIIIGDAFLLTGILLLWKEYATFDIPTILAVAHPSAITVFAGVCIIVGAISKSAQFPLHTWLPDAMEGPTPVSAFLHSAAMVKAGLFLIARFLPLLLLVGLAPVIIGIAVITIIISACMALVENDIKRVLAYSTMNQLAFILLALGLGATAAGMYHLLNHSIFKALLFLCAGVIIHIAGTQDITKMESLRLRFGWNLLAISTLVGALALGGLPPFSGFFSKDAIFEAVLATNSIALIAVFCVAVVLSALYIFRWYFLIFRKDAEPVMVMAETEARLHQDAPVSWEMRTPLPLLALLAALGGAIAWIFFSWWSAGSASYPVIGVPSIITTLLSLLGALIAYFAFYTKSLDVDGISNSIFAAVFRARFLIDDLYDALARAVADIGLAFAWLDQRVIDGFLDGIAHFFTRLGGLMRRAVSGRTVSYLAMIIVGFVIVILTVMVRP